MKISFAIPAHNEEKNIADCIRAIQAEIGSGNTETEIIVIDNASVDQTAEIASSFPGVRVVRENQKGLVFARARGQSEASGDIIANIDADTRIPKGWLAVVERSFADDPNLVGLSGRFIYYDASFLTKILTRVFYYAGYVFYLLNKHILGVGAMLQGGNFVIKKEAFDRLGGYDLSIDFYGEDTDVARRLNKVGNVVFTFALPAYSSARRLHNEGVFTTGFRYGLNYFWTIFFNKPLTKKYRDFR